MTDPYYTDKLEGWNHMIEWITTKGISFKDFCMKYKMDYILFSGYVPFLEKMSSDKERHTFVTKRIASSEDALNKHLLSIEMKELYCSYPKCMIKIDD